jgi:2,3-bisphosphoglycerate-independent phosphoglycerate mutase
MDGVGLGGPDPAVNPFVTARLPHLSGLLGEGWYLNSRGPITTDRASLVPTDACLGVPGRPQSATGQATILTGRNVPQLVGEHYGPKPNEAVAAIIRQGTLFQEVVATGGTAALLTPYPPGYFAGIQSGKRLLSSVPLAAVSAGLKLMDVDDLRTGRAVSPDFTAQGWRDHMGYQDVPLLTLNEAGRHIASLARQYTFTFFEHWPSDRAGHRGSLEQAARHLELLDEAIGGILDNWDDAAGLLVITSDHGNIEEKQQRNHSFHPVPTILVGPGHQEAAGQIHTLADIASVIRRFLLGS